MHLKLFQIYSLSNPHFQRVELSTKNNGLLKGQFVQFKVVKGDLEYLYPAEKFCFLPEDKKIIFWKNYNLNNGEFKTFPDYIKLFGLNDILEICIEPLQII